MSQLTVKALVVAKCHPRCRMLRTPADGFHRDKLVGMSLASELGCIALGLFIIVFFRFVRLPLLEVRIYMETFLSERLDSNSCMAPIIHDI